ncbi:MAG TPA: AAA family ATPase [Tetrasphaera sp.]|uniref:AAA family ATPase n=1 Tax=Nostocoides sp. TaxID=1917966 RepID=UPI002C2C08EF|nr:AAA family ATPase [Tetrasphaera sp.]HNQ06483.1 AAA family ATPase [Tetrasphaera sp.]
MRWSDPLPVRRVRRASDASLDPDQWPMTLAPVRQLLQEGLDLGRITVLVGENGTGKSTLVEAIAMAFGLPAEGGSTGAMHRTYASESALHDDLTLERGAGASKWGYFLRAETTHGLFTYLANNPGPRDPDFHRMSHGESFLAMLGSGRFRGDGFFVMDEPEAGLSFSAQLALVGTLHALAQHRSAQVLMATHSPVLAAIPGATILELDHEGLHPRDWSDLDVVDNYRRFLATPGQYLRHVID